MCDYLVIYLFLLFFFFFKQKTAYEMRISDWSSDVCSSDLLRLIGYGRRDALAHRLTAWEGVLDTVRPDVVVGDFSPTLNLAARGRVPSIVVGNGYTIPPGGRPMPPIRPWQPALEAFSVTHEAELMATANAAQIGRAHV